MSSIFILIFILQVLSASLPKESVQNPSIRALSIHDTTLAITDSQDTNLFNLSPTSLVEQNAVPSNRHSVRDPSQIQRRVGAGRTILECPDWPPYTNGTFVQSRCAQRINLHFLRILCQYRDDELEEWVEFRHTVACANDEVCIERRESRIIEYVAYCARIISFRQVINREIGKNFHFKERYALSIAEELDLFGRPVRRSLGFVFAPGTTLATTPIKSSTTTPAEEPTIVADSLTIMAQSVKSIFNAVSYQTLGEALASCAHCASIALQLIPAGARSILVNGVLPAGVSTIDFYLVELD